MKFIELKNGDYISVDMIGRLAWKGEREGENEWEVVGRDGQVLGMLPDYMAPDDLKDDAYLPAAISVEAVVIGPTGKVPPFVMEVTRVLVAGWRVVASWAAQRVLPDGDYMNLNVMILLPLPDGSFADPRNRGIYQTLDAAKKVALRT